MDDLRRGEYPLRREGGEGDRLVLRRESSERSSESVSESDESSESVSDDSSSESESDDDDSASNIARRCSIIIFGAFYSEGSSSLVYKFITNKQKENNVP